MAEETAAGQGQERKPVLPVAGRRNVLVTSALPYVNNVPHLGNLVGCVLSADAYARYCRLRGHNVLFICGTDEYGTSTEARALQEGCSPREICDRYHALHRKVYSWFGISFDHFGRTSSPEQTEICQDVFRRLLDNGWLLEKTIQQLHCGGECQRFLADRLVEGSCPVQGCGEKLERYRRGLWRWVLEPKRRPGDQRLVEGRAQASMYHQGPQVGRPCATRQVQRQVLLYTHNYFQVMFPSTLLGTGENWTLLKTISVTEYLNYESGKFSKSKGIGVFGNDARDTNIPPEVWRYYLLTNRPEVRIDLDSSDTQFTWTDLQAKLNNELVHKLGNFINRVLSFIAKPEGVGYGSIIPPATNAESHPLTQAISETVGKLVDQYIVAMDKVKLKQGLKITMAICSEGNAYLQDSQFWKLYKEDPPGCATVIKTSAGLVYLLACLLEPFMPSFSKEVLQQLNLCPEEHLSFCDEKGEREKAKRPWDLIPPGHRIGKPAPLFKGLVILLHSFGCSLHRIGNATFISITPYTVSG
ncbi:hypothetical protein HU200_021809 [Digitaria exilis]|uniref:methionine--tRNA ligase n=1 Tax=Digitaria exilis TaxID=1010633 RepID=A0A835EYX4_9POAL|nr:hypothetical protein HU200_021809 [Digitaria exilis]